MKRTLRIAAAVSAACMSGMSLGAQDRPAPTAVWAPKPTRTAAYPPSQKPIVKLSDIKARHKDQPNWHELLVDDGRLTGEYWSAAPGTKVGRRLHPDTREWFAVVEGEIRVEIEGQTPFTATRGSIVNIPRQTIYALETTGDKPSLRFAVNVSRAKTLYPREPGDAAPSVARRRHGLAAGDDESHAGTVRPVQPAAPQRPRGRGAERELHRRTLPCATTSPRCSSSTGTRRTCRRSTRTTRGTSTRRAPSSGSCSSARSVMRSRVSSRSSRSEGDVVYVPANTWHATRFYGAEPACRLSITEYVGNALLLEPRPR